MSFPQLLSVKELDTAVAVTNRTVDAVLIISSSLYLPQLPEIEQLLISTQEVDQRLGQQAVLIHSEQVPGQRLIHAPTGSLNRDYDDVKVVNEAAIAAVQLAVQAGAKRPLLIFTDLPSRQEYQQALKTAYLAVCQALWQPLEAREALGEDRIESVERITIYDPKQELDYSQLAALESGRRLARDLCSAEPERMTPIKFAEYCQQAFTGFNVDVEIEADQQRIATSYPLLAAVARASQPVPHHHPRVIKLSYTPMGPIKNTIFLVGKAVTFDTGGADLKISGSMAGMSKDKGGAASVAGFMQTVAALEPEGLQVIAYIGAVRNDIGSAAYVPDEIITARSGKRVRIGNTDAEGRLVMADLLTRCKELALNAINPALFTIATLTGHAARSYGPYSAVMESGTAQQKHIGRGLVEQGELWADCAELSQIRKDDWDFIRPTSLAEDMISSNNGPSVAVARGHQFPMAFLSLVSGLEQHGRHSQQPLAYVHLDIAGSAFSGITVQPAMLTALAAYYQVVT